VNSVVDLQSYKELKDAYVASYSILDMISSPQKKKEYDEYLSRTYVENEDDDFFSDFFRK